MNILISGVLVWIVVHLTPAIARPLRGKIIDRLGNNGYRGLFALAIFGSIALIVVGWRSTPETFVYALPDWTSPVGFVLMIVAFVLLGAAQYRSLIKRYVRHPMLAGVFIWAASHLLTNGSTRALVLFGGLGLWALIEMLLISKREGIYTRPEATTFSAELKGVFISAVVFTVVLLLHPYYTGVSLLPR